MSLSEALVSGPLLCDSNETMHAKVGQAQRPGAELRDDQYSPPIGQYRQNWPVSFDGGHPINGEVKL